MENTQMKSIKGTAQIMMYSVKDFFSKFDQIRFVRKKKVNTQI